MVTDECVIYVLNVALGLRNTCFGNKNNL